MAKRVKKNGPGWDKIGKMIGSKVEKEMKGGECCKPWYKMGKYHGDNAGGGFFGRALFVIGVLMALNALGVLHGVNIWVQVLIGAGFALMRMD